MLEKIIQLLKDWPESELYYFQDIETLMLYSAPRLTAQAKLLVSYKIPSEVAKKLLNIQTV